VLVFIIIFYTVVGLAGIYFLVRLLSGNPVKIIAGVIHGSLGLIGIAILITYISFSENVSVVPSIILFLIAFLIGGGMIFQRADNKSYPVLVAVIHGAIALTGIIFLYLSFFS
jgi:hypothetical protein